MSDLLRWLRKEAEFDESGGCQIAAANHRKAADQIQRLQAENLSCGHRESVLAAEISRLQSENTRLRRNLDEVRK